MIVSKTDTVIQYVGRREKYDLLEICSDGFTLILQLLQTSEYGDLDVLRQRICELLNKIEHDAKEVGIDYEDIHMAIFALIAFLDETIIASQWNQKHDWLAKPLQLEFFNRFDAGEEFFVRLENLRQRPQYYSSVLEVYYLCLALGFKGKYQLHEREKLRRVVEDAYTILRQIKGKTTDTLSPHGQRKDEIIEVVKKEIPVWVIAVSAFAIGFFFYIIMTFFINDAANDVTRIIKNIT